MCFESWIELNWACSCRKELPDRSEFCLLNRIRISLKIYCIWTHRRAVCLLLKKWLQSESPGDAAGWQATYRGWKPNAGNKLRWGSKLHCLDLGCRSMNRQCIWGCFWQFCSLYFRLLDWLIAWGMLPAFWRHCWKLVVLMAPWLLFPMLGRRRPSDLSSCHWTFPYICFFYSRYDQGYML